MRLRVGLLLCLFSVIAAVGCRKPLTPNIDRNRAPETWITAAPFDTITLVKGQPPLPGTIPIRFHVYWAGSDQDGAVVGYYWAVVETLPHPAEGATRPPPLPGPRPRDYHYTTHTDSTFIFNVAEDVPDRQHAFFIYAVDEQGKPDPTPARFVFNALDRFPPLPVFDLARATGTVYFFDTNGILRSETRAFDIRDTVKVPPGVPKDTVPSDSRLTFRFHGDVTLLGSVVKGFRYKLDEAELQPRDPDSLYHGDLIEYRVPAASADPARLGLDTLPVAPGTKVFSLRAVDQANGSRDATRRFQLNFSPETWFAGPDPDVAATTAPPGNPWVIKPNGEKYALLVNGRVPPGGLPGTLLGPDSVRILPVNRPPHRTFLEIYQDTMFLRHEFDTVHMASWVVIHNGGFDRDSKYLVKVADGIETLMPPGSPLPFPGGVVLTKGMQNGSPIGFRTRITNALTPIGTLSSTAQSGIYPLYDPNDVLHFPRIGAYHPMFLAGKAYSLQRAEDGDGARDGRIAAGDEWRVGNNPAHPLRPLVLVFYVNYPPELLTGRIGFRPSVTVVDTFYDSNWALHLPADDADPYVSGAPLGGPSSSKTLRLRFKITGKDTLGQPLTFSDPPASGVQQKYIGVTDVNLPPMPANLASGPVTLTVELCDCSFCELNAGEGRCITRDIEVYYKPPSPIPAAANTGRPGPN